MTEDRKKELCLDDIRNIYTKRKYETDIGPINEEEPRTGTEWKTKEEKI